MAYSIGIAGTHSTGKSTFIEELKTHALNRGISVSVIANVASACQDIGFKVLLDHTFESTLWIVCSVIRAELEAELKADLVLVDRPVPDALGYLEAALEMSGRTITRAQREYLYGLARSHTPQYSLLFKTELDVSIPLGEGRDTNEEYRKSAGKCVSRVLDDLNIKALNPLDPDARIAIDRVLSTIIAQKAEGANQ